MCLFRRLPVGDLLLIQPTELMLGSHAKSPKSVIYPGEGTCPADATYPCWSCTVFGSVEIDGSGYVSSKSTQDMAAK